jgi:hypothetical protein
MARKALSHVIWKPDDLYFWAGLMATKKHFFRLGTFFIKDGSDIWHNIVRHKGDTLTHILEPNPPNVTFRRIFLGPRLVSWHALLQRLANV